MTKIERKTETYKYKDGFYIDVVFFPDVVEVWLYHKDVGVKIFMFGLGIDEKNNSALLELIKNNLIYQDYITDYKNSYF